MRLTIHCGKLTVMPEEGFRKFQERLPIIYQAMGLAYITFLHTNWRKEQSPDGEKWAQLSPATAKTYVPETRVRRGYHPILRVTGHMTDLYTRVERDGVTVGTNVNYGPLHQFGGHTGKGRKSTVPARPWLFSRHGGVPERFRQRLENMVEKELTKCLS